MRPFLAVPALCALAASAAALPGQITVSTRLVDDCRLNTELTGAKGSIFGVQVSADASFTGTVHTLGLAPLDATGKGRHSVVLPNPQNLPLNFTGWVRAAWIEKGKLAYSAPQALLFNPVPVERVGFTWAPDCSELVRGDRVDEQYAPVGVHVFADTHHPTNEGRTVAIDSRVPGLEPDLATPGAGPGNRRGWEMLLAVAGSLVDQDQDGRIDEPTAEPLGGVLVFDFDQPVYLDRITLVDVDQPGSVMRCFMGNTMVAEMGVPTAGENSVQTIAFPLEPVTRLKVNVRCAAAVAELSYLPCAERVNFDHTMTGIPLDLREGEVVTQQLRTAQGMRVFADSHHPKNVGRAIAVRGADEVVAGDAEGLVLGVAADPADADQDGVVDAPGLEPLGGVIVIDFDFDVTWRSAHVADVDGGEVSFFKAYDAQDVLLGVFSLTPGADRAIQEVAPDLAGVRRIKLNLGGTGALVSLDYCAEAHPEIALQ